MYACCLYVCILVSVYDCVHMLVYVCVYICMHTHTHILHTRQKITQHEHLTKLWQAKKREEKKLRHEEKMRCDAYLHAQIQCVLHTHTHTMCIYMQTYDLYLHAHTRFVFTRTHKMCVHSCPYDVYMVCMHVHFSTQPPY